MTKHLYFDPTNFDELILSGLLIQIYKTDIELHTRQSDQPLKFVQGPNVVENTIGGILKFANTQARRKFYGLNRKQQAIIDMVNGVCKDIDSKLNTVESSQDLNEKITYLNELWQNSSYSWLKSQFYQCHMNMLTLSFRVQQTFPELLAKFTVFVDLRKSFISDKWLSKQSLIAMFANPSNKYQEFDLFPETEGECSLSSSFGKPAESGEKDTEIQYVEENFVEIQSLQADGDYQQQFRGSKKLNHQLYEQQRVEPQTQQPIQQQQPTETMTKQAVSETAQISELSHQTLTASNVHEQQNSQHQHHGEHPQDVTSSHFSNLTVTQTTEQQTSHVEPLQVVRSNINKEESGVVSELVSEIRESHEHHFSVQHQKQQSSTHPEHEPAKLSHHLDAHHHDSEVDGQQESNTKKSLKQSFSQLVTKPLEYSTRSMAEEDKQHQIETKTLETEQLQTHPQEKIHSIPEVHSQNQLHEESSKEEKEEQKHTDSNQNDLKTQTVEAKIEEAAPVKLQKQVIIDEAESEKYVSQQHMQPLSQKNDAHQAAEQQKKTAAVVQPQPQPSPIQKQAPQQKLQQSNSKAPQSQSIASESQKGPKSNMNQKNSIKPKEQAVPQQKETCKCEIY